MDTSAVAGSIEGFVRQAFNVRDDDPSFDRSTDLFDRGYVDSIGLVELLEFVSAEFGVEIPEEDLLGDDFATIDGIARAVCRQAPAAANISRSA